MSHLLKGYRRAAEPNISGEKEMKGVKTAGARHYDRQFPSNKDTEQVDLCYHKEGAV